MQTIKINLYEHRVILFILFYNENPEIAAANQSSNPWRRRGSNWQPSASEPMSYLLHPTATNFLISFIELIEKNHTSVPD